MYILIMKAVVLGWKRDHLSEYYDDCKSICYNLAKEGYDVVTGGGSGFMNIANKGAFDFDKNKSYGISVECLKNEHNENVIDKNFKVTKDFSERKKELIKGYDIVIFFPGGMGTLDEFTEVMNLLKTKELEFKTVILYGYKYWNSLISWFEFNKISFPHNYITGIVDSVNEFNSLFSKNVGSDSEGTIEEIKNYEPIFTKKTIFNPFDDIDELINSIFNDPNMLKDIDFKNGTTLLNDIKEEENEDETEDKVSEEIAIKLNEPDEESSDNEIIIEILYESSESSHSVFEDDTKDIDPIDFISDSDSKDDDE